MSSLTELIRTVPTPFNMVVIIVLITSCAGVVSAVAKQIRKYACHRQELEFKRELLDRGLAPEEIELVIRARGTDGSTT